MLTSTAGQEESQTQAAMSNYHCIQLLLPAILTLTMLSFLNSFFFFLISLAIGCSNIISVTAVFLVTSLIALELRYPCLATFTYSGLGEEKKKPEPNPETHQLCVIIFFSIVFTFYFI